MGSIAEFAATLQIIAECETVVECDDVARHLQKDEGFKTWEPTFKNATRMAYKIHRETLVILGKCPATGTTNSDAAGSQPSSTSPGQNGSATP